MSLYSIYSELTYRAPPAAAVPLNSELASTIRSFQKTRRESLHHLCLIAYGLRRSNLVKTKGRGGNAQGQILSDRFKAWYKAERLSEVYGSESNFTTYAMCGRLLEYTRWQIDRKKGSRFIDALPASLGTMYEISKVLWQQGDKTTPEGRETYQSWLTNPIGDGSPPKVFISPSLTRKEVVRALARLNGNDEVSPTPSASDDPSPNPPSENREQPKRPIIATVTISPSSLLFTKTGKSKGATAEAIRAFESDLRELIKKHGRHFDIASNLDAVLNEIEQAAHPDFGKHL